MGFEPGDDVMVEWGGQYYEAKLGPQNAQGLFYLTYKEDGTYEDNVPLNRLRAIPKASTTSSTQAGKAAGTNFGTASPPPVQTPTDFSGTRATKDTGKIYTYQQIKEMMTRENRTEQEIIAYWKEGMVPVAGTTLNDADPLRAAAVDNDPFMTHGQFAPRPQSTASYKDVEHDPFMTSEAKSGPSAIHEPPEHRHDIKSDPFLTTGADGSRVPDRRSKSPVMSQTAAHASAAQNLDRLTYRFFDLEWLETEALRAEFKHEFLTALQKRGVEGYTLTQLRVKMRRGSILVEVSGEPQYVDEVRRKCPSRSVVIRGCMGVLVDPDRPDEPLPDAQDGQYVVQEEQAEPEVPAEPIIPYWYKAENNWIQCIEMMRLEHERIKLEHSGAWMIEERIREETRAEKAKEWIYDHTKGKLGQQYKVTVEQVKVRDIYQDDRFPPDQRIWYRGGEPGPLSTMPQPTRWERLMSFSCDTPYPTVDYAAGMMQPRGGRVYQGCPENFYLIAALQALAMKPQLIANVFCNMEFSSPNLGLFMMRFYKHGQWQYVDIDDALPMMMDYQPMCAQSEFWPAYSWPALIEKGYAKMHGSYEALGGGGHVEEVLADLTGGCATRYGTRDVANDRLWMYLYEMQKHCIFGCNINEAECSKRNIPIESHWASAIWKVAKFNQVPYICVCTSAPASTCIHMPACQVPSPDGYGPNEGFCWLRVDDFVQLFDTIYECRLVNSDLGPPNLTGIACSPGWVPNGPWFEELWAFQAQVYSETAPCFLIDVPQVPCEITIEVSQTDHRYNDAGNMQDFIFGRQVQAPLLLRFYQCSKEVSEVSGGEIYLVHLSAWGHTRDACTGVKVKQPGRYMAMVSVPAKYVCHKMIFRTYSSFPIRLSPVTNHRSFVVVHPAMPLGAMPYHLCGFQRVESTRESMPQMFDEAEGRGKPMANPMYEGATTGAMTQWGAGWGGGGVGGAYGGGGGKSPLAFLWPFPFPGPCQLLGCGSPKGFLGTGLCRGAGGMSINGMPSGMIGLPGMPGMPGIGGLGGGWGLGGTGGPRGGGWGLGGNWGGMPGMHGGPHMPGMGGMHMPGMGGMHMPGMGGMHMPGAGGMRMPGMGGMHMPGMGGMHLPGMGGFGWGRSGAADDGMKVVGKFGGRDAIATVEANEAQGACVVM